MNPPFTVALFIGLVAAVTASFGDTMATPLLEVRQGERLLVVAPHPDDETLGAGGLIQRVLAQGGTVRVVVITAGDGYVEAVEHETGKLRPHPADFIRYGERRMREVRAAVRALGQAGPQPRLYLLGFPDGGIDPLLQAHWRRRHPERSKTTAATDPPYPEALDPDLAYDGEDLRRALTELIREADPTTIVLPSPLDRHPDHRATGLFTLMAVAESKLTTAPRLLSYLIHWPAWPPGWDQPTPTAATAALALDLPPDLPPEKTVTRFTLALRDEELSRKGAALSLYRTQQLVMPGLLAAFVRRTEPFIGLTLLDAARADEEITHDSARRREHGR